MTVDEQLTQNNAIKLSDRVVVCFTIRVIPVGFNEGEGTRLTRGLDAVIQSTSEFFATFRRIRSAFLYCRNSLILSPSCGGSLTILE